jgi:TonB family protein
MEAIKIQYHSLLRLGLNQMYPILFLGLFTPGLYAQIVTDTMYFDRDWQQAEKENARYYRVISMDTSGQFLFYVTDYYLSGQEQMTGTYRTIRPDFREGTFNWFYEDGSKQQSCEYKDNLLHGPYLEWHKNGQIQTRQNFSKGLPDGPYKKWDKKGLLKFDAQFEKGERHGNFITYYDNGQMTRKDLYDHGRLVEGQCFSPDGDSVEYFPYMVQPQFKGGIPALRKFLHKELKYPKQALKEEKEDIVIVIFSVDTTGNVINPRIIQGSKEESFNEEALRIVSSFPDWIPGKLDKKISQLEVTLPVEFRLK